MAKTDIAGMTDLAVAQLSEVQTTGRLKLPNGKILELEPNDVVRVIQWLATQRERKLKILATPEDIELAKTRHAAS